MRIKSVLILVLSLLISQCNSYDAPYTPKGLQITDAYREWKNAKFHEFANFSVVLANNTDEDFKMVKYRVKIFLVVNGKKTEVFSKAYEYHQRLNSGDVIKLPIYDLTEFHIGVDIREDNGWTWGGYIEDATPI